MMYSGSKGGDLYAESINLNYLSPSDDEVRRYINPLKGLSKADVRIRILQRWRLVYNLLFGVVIIQHQKEAVNAKITLFGRQLINEQLKSPEDSEKISSMVIRTQSNFRLVWNIIFILLMIYTSMFVPY